MSVSKLGGYVGLVIAAAVAAGARGQLAVDGEASVQPAELVARARAAAQSDQRVARELYLAALGLAHWPLDISTEYARFEQAHGLAAAREHRWREAQIRVLSGFQEGVKAVEAFRALAEGTDVQLRELLATQDALADEIMFVDEQWRREIAQSAREYVATAERLYEASKGRLWDDQAKQREVLWTLQRASDSLAICPEDIRRRWEDLADTVKRELGEKSFDAELVKIKVARGAQDIRFIDGAQAVANKEPGRYEAYVALRDEWCALQAAGAPPAGFDESALLARLDRFVQQYPGTAQGDAVAEVTRWLRAEQRAVLTVKAVGRYTSLPRRPRETLRVSLAYGGDEVLSVPMPDVGPSEWRSLAEQNTVVLTVRPFAQLELKLLRSDKSGETSVLYCRTSGIMDLHTLAREHVASTKLSGDYKVVLVIEPAEPFTVPALP